MIALFFALTSLCPKMGTGTFYFAEKIVQEETKDSFFGALRVEDSIINIQVSYPDTQRYTIRGDSIYMFEGQDTIVVYRKGLLSLILNQGRDDKFRHIPFAGGCIVLPSDTLLPDSIYVYGKRTIDSLKAEKDNFKVFIKFWRK